MAKSDSHLILASPSSRHFSTTARKTSTSAAWGDLIWWAGTECEDRPFCGNFALLLSIPNLQALKTHSKHHQFWSEHVVGTIWVLEVGPIPSWHEPHSRAVVICLSLKTRLFLAVHMYYRIQGASCPSVTSVDGRFVFEIRLIHRLLESIDSLYYKLTTNYFFQAFRDKPISYKN